MKHSPLRTLGLLLRDPAAKGRAASVCLRYGWLRILKFTRREAWLRMPGTGLAMHYVPGCTVTERCHILGRYDADGWGLLEACLLPGDRFYDVGANVGPWTLFAAQRGVDVVAIEASARTFARLRRNLQRNRAEKVSCLRLAVSDRDGELKFADAPISALSAVAATGEAVPARSLASLARELGPPQLLKIDTEGHEPQVFDGLAPLLDQHPPRCIIFEAAGHYSQAALAGIGDLLARSGYTLGLYDAQSRRFKISAGLGDRSPRNDYHALSAEGVSLLERRGVSFVRREDPRRDIPVLGLPVSGRSLDEVVATSLAAIEGRGAPQFLACANPHSLVVARGDAAFRRALGRADIIVADGVGLTVAVRWLFRQAPPRVTGYAMFTGIMQALERRGGGRVFFLGSRERTLELIRRRVAADYPRVTVAGVYSPPFGEWPADEDAAIVERIRAANPDVLWVGMTAPKQEKWIAAHRAAVGAPVVAAIGAVFDYYAGTVRRAPAWVCDLGLEWLYRLAHEPRRLWRRTLVSTPVFLGMMLRERMRRTSAVRGAVH